MAHESHCNEFSMMQGFEHNHEFFSIPAGMEILGATSKQQQSFLHRHFPEASNKNLMVPAAETATSVSPWPVADDSSLRSVFNGRPSLSLFNMKHSDAVTVPQPLQLSVSRDHKLQLRAEYLQGQHPFMEDGIGFHQQRPLQLRSTKFLRPAQELLNEFASLLGDSSSKKRPKVEGKPSFTSSWHQSLYSMDLLELQKIKAQLLSMLEEVDKRYIRYCQQMRTVVASFEAMAGEGAARVYSALASKAMSRHFRCLRDGIAFHVGAVRKAMGEKDSADTAPPGTTRGETPRLKLLDQCIRQQNAFQQGMITMEQHPWRPQRGLPERAVSTLRAWLFEHFLHPYPNEADKRILSQQTGLSRSQVSNWFINARVRLWKPMVEEMYLEEMKEMDNNQTNPATDGQDDSDRNPNPNSNLSFDKKPFADSESLSSIINGNRYGDQIYTDSSSIKNASLQQQYRQHDGGHRQVPGADNFDAIGDTDYFPYSDCGSSRISRAGVSLTLGLQHHDTGGMSLSLLPNSIEEDDQQFQFSILDGEADQNLPYRNLVEAQLLHDLAR